MCALDGAPSTPPTRSRWACRVEVTPTITTLRQLSPQGKASSPKIVVNPTSDKRSRDDARRLAADGAGTPQELERRLKARYAKARVVPCITEVDTQRWYVYRAGCWVSSEEALDQGRWRAPRRASPGGSIRALRPGVTERPARSGHSVAAFRAVAEAASARLVDTADQIAPAPAARCTVRGLPEGANKP